jgi:hypothetical protein
VRRLLGPYPEVGADHDRHLDQEQHRGHHQGQKLASCEVDENQRLGDHQDQTDLAVAYQDFRRMGLELVVVDRSGLDLQVL